ncbi:hypothetical protein ACFQH6_17500 [Halobacteriaceae archaeon GCM10025711]
MPPSIRRTVLTLVTVGFVAVSGCLGGLPPGTPTTTTDDMPAYGTEFVSVERLDNQNRYTEWPNDEAAVFADLSNSRQRVFRDALENGTVEFSPSDPNPFSSHNKERPKVVRYDGTWYYVRVAVV